MYLGADWKQLSTLVPSTELAGLVVFALAVNAWLILWVSRGANWARIVLLVNLILQLPGAASWRGQSALLVILSVAGMALQTVAMYLLFRDPGRRWFHRSTPDTDAAV
jgi:hypothetical protein